MVNVKPIFKNITDNDKTLFQLSQCLLLVSVGQEAHEGERFKSTIELINSSFKSCIILLYDSLQRHTMALNSIKEPNEFHKVARGEGDLWLERNEESISRLSIFNGISRWDSWLNHPHFIKQQKQLKQLIEFDTNYQLSFDTINSYLDRYSKRLEDSFLFNLDRAKSICLDYIIEECTVLCLWPDLQCQFEIYPNYHNNAIEATRERFIKPNYPELLRAIRLGFRNGKQVKPQRFALLESEAS